MSTGTANTAREKNAARTCQGGGKRRFIYPCTLYVAQQPLQQRRLQAVQDHIQVGAINVVVLRKGDLTSLVFNCGSQQIKNVIIVEYKLNAAQTLGEGNCKSFVIGFGGHWCGPRNAQ
jgi:hypothetical protein